MAAQKLTVKARFFVCFFALVWSVCAQNTKNFYTQPKDGAGGGITAKVDAALTYAIALERDRTSAYKATLSEENTRFHFPNLPTGKYDLLLFTKQGVLFEGLQLGEAFELGAGESRKNLEERIAKADAFFNKYKLHRMGVIEGGSKLLALVERMRDKETLTGGGEKLAGPVRRFEVAQFDKAADTWSFMVNRHLYREEEKAGQSAFLDSKFVPALGSVRVIESLKDLGVISLKP
jgi:hypothetical protein